MAKINGTLKTIVVIAGLILLILGLVWDASTKSSVLDVATKDIEKIKDKTVPQVTQNKEDIRAITTEMAWVIQGQDDIMDKQEKQLEVLMEIKGRLPDE